MLFALLRLQLLFGLLRTTTMCYCTGSPVVVHVFTNSQLCSQWHLLVSCDPPSQRTLDAVSCQAGCDELSRRHFSCLQQCFLYLQHIRESDRWCKSIGLCTVSMAVTQHVVVCLAVNLRMFAVYAYTCILPSSIPPLPPSVHPSIRPRFDAPLHSSVCLSMALSLLYLVTSCVVRMSTLTLSNTLNRSSPNPEIRRKRPEQCTAPAVSRSNRAILASSRHFLESFRSVPSVRDFGAELCRAAFRLPSFVEVCFRLVG